MQVLLAADAVLDLWRGTHLRNIIQIIPDKVWMEVRRLFVTVTLNDKVPSFKSPIEARVLCFLEEFGEDLIFEYLLVMNHEAPSVG